MSFTLTKTQPKKAPIIPAGHIHRRLSPSKTTGSGVVNYYVHGRMKMTVRHDFTTANLVKLMEVGLPVRELTDLQASLAVPADRLAPMLGISKATFHRSKGAGSKLNSAVSDRVVRFAKLMGKAVEVMESEENARQWLNSPQFGLGGAVPLEYAKTEVGAREVENLLGRIEYGVYS
jgi:putative toxin-antitoxin system antitoxin component (TIGR02293 family)